MNETERQLARLETRLTEIDRLAVAVSGGVDSMTLAVVAHRVLGERAGMCHAVSPAVPAEATARVEAYAGREGWRLQTLNAGEFDDPRYLANPANRCFFCKTNLYGAMVGRVDAQLVSGTNLDDLGDYRPGLEAARNHDVLHPFVDCGIDKAAVRAIARHLGLDDLSELPAAPCLSSRIETGLPIEAPMLAAVHSSERLVRARLSPATVRCRVRHDAVVIELDAAALGAMAPADEDGIASAVAAHFDGIGIDRPVRFSPYRMGSAFLRPRNE